MADLFVTVTLAGFLPESLKLIVFFFQNNNHTSLVIINASFFIKRGYVCPMRPPPS